jgi:hypothetical protein
VIHAGLDDLHLEGLQIEHLKPWTPSGIQVVSPTRGQQLAVPERSRGFEKCNQGWACKNADGGIRIFFEGELTRSASARGVVPVTCREFADFMTDYLSDELSTESRAAFEYHLSLCTNCRLYLTSYRETVKLGKRAFEDVDADVSSQVPEGLVKAILAARPRR